METTRLIDVVQLSLRDGILSLNQPMKLKPQPLADLAIQLRQFLTTENAEHLIFGFNGDGCDVKVTLNAKELRWAERSENEITTTIFVFETGFLTENGIETPNHHTQAFTTKIDRFLKKMESGEVRVRIKAKELRI
ncbi:hypothetical protein EBR57_04405 [bacterium]|nr:hypothetical protein [bacterium]